MVHVFTSKWPTLCRALVLAWFMSHCCSFPVIWSRFSLKVMLMLFLWRGQGYYLLSKSQAQDLNSTLGGWWGWGGVRRNSRGGPSQMFIFPECVCFCCLKFSLVAVNKVFHCGVSRGPADTVSVLGVPVPGPDPADPQQPGQGQRSSALEPNGYITSWTVLQHSNEERKQIPHGGSRREEFWSRYWRNRKHGVMNIQEFNKVWN